MAIITATANFLCHVWFGLWAFAGLIIDWAACTVIYLVCDTTEKKQKYCCMVCHWAFRWFFIKPSPWIGISEPPYEDILRLMDRENVFLLMNHTSFWDSVLFVGITPPNIIWRYRTLMKYKLFDMPLLGSICHMVGHFPVYFTSKDENSFVVDKQKQADVMSKVRAHVAKRGCLALYPEGKLNRTPEVLCSFRRGMFGLAEEHKMAVVGLTNVGNQAAWPVDSALGGLPTRITLRLTEIAEAGHDMSAEDIRMKAQDVMQADVTAMMEDRGMLKSKES